MLKNGWIYLITIGTKLISYLPSESSHSIALLSLKVLNLLKVNPFSHYEDKTNLCGIGFINKVGLGAGLDKNGDYIDSLAMIGFGFLELGTVTPLAQKGNSKPRLFRIRSNKALVNSMGFNNKGVDHLVSNILNRKSKIPLGISIGKNLSTPLENAVDDYLICLEKVYKVADYIAINISSPNTKDLRSLETKVYFKKLITALKEKQTSLSHNFKYVPLFLKISPDISESNLTSLISVVLEKKIDGLICSNTTTDHQHPSAKGGLSGQPLYQSSTQQLLKVRELVGQDFPIIASGGVIDKEGYLGKLNSGANLVQVYTGLIYEGPGLVEDLLR